MNDIDDSNLFLTGYNLTSFLIGAHVNGQDCILDPGDDHPANLGTPNHSTSSTPDCALPY
jgi:hypothetical protein